MRHFNLSGWAVSHPALILFLVVALGVQKLDPTQKVRVVSSLSF